VGVQTVQAVTVAGQGFDDPHVDGKIKVTYLFENGNLIKSYPIAVGTQRNPSHIGIWKIVSKSDWGEGFGGTWMGLSIPWGIC
jgi:hypothetical protein